TEKFPEYEGNHLILGKLRWDRFRQNLVPKDGVKAVEHFEQAASLNPNNYKVLFQLAKIYVEIGAVKKAKEKINTMLQYFPNDENAMKLLRRAQLLQESAYHEDLEDLFKAFKEKNPNLKKTSTTMGGNISQRLLKDPNFAQTKLEALKSLPGLLGLLVCDSDNNIVFSYYVEASWKGQVEEVIQRSVKAAKDCSLRMDIGSLQDSRIEGPDGWIYMKSFVQILFVMLFSPKAKFRQVEHKISEFFEFGIYQ
ncbi:MAG: tetratricopeptide repeat protein, partial [Planctomycetota bacterium]